MLLAHGKVVYCTGLVDSTFEVTYQPGCLRPRRTHRPEALNVVSPCGQFQRLIKSRIDTRIAATGAQTPQSDPYRETAHDRGAGTLEHLSGHGGGVAPATEVDMGQCLPG